MFSTNQATALPDGIVQRMSQWVRRRPSLQFGNGIILAYMNLLIVAVNLFPNPNDLTMPRYLVSFALLGTIGLITAGLTELPEHVLDDWAASWIGGWGPVLIYIFLAFLTSWVARLVYSHWLIFFPIVFSFSLPRLRDTLSVHIAIVVLWFLFVWSYAGSPLIAREETFDLLVSIFWFSGFLLMLRKHNEANAHLEESRKRTSELAVAEERVHMAREIHDGLGHHLTALDIQLRAATKLLERNPEQLATTLVDCQQEAKAAMQEARRSVSMMRSSPVEGQALIETITRAVDNFTRSSSVPVQFTNNGGEPVLTASMAMTLYRAVQEGLTNIQKHAHNTDQIMIALSFEPEETTLSIYNDGSKLSPSAVSFIKERRGKTAGFGLIGLRERVEHLGGTLQAETDNDQGFTLTISLPSKYQD